MLFIMSLWSVLYISYEIAINDSNTMKHLTGLLSGQFKVLFNFVNDVCPLDKLTYWSYSGKKHSSREPTATQMTLGNQLVSGLQKKYSSSACYDLKGVLPSKHCLFY